MVTKELYLEVLEYTDNGLFLAGKVDVFENNDFIKIGDIAISMILDKFDAIDYNGLKQIVCMRLNYDKKKYQETSHDDLCAILCEKIIRFKTYPADEFTFVKNSYRKTQKRYDEVILKLNNEIETIECLIRTDKNDPKKNGTLVKQQERLCSVNVATKSLLKDLTKIEEDYISLYDEIQENYVRQEMLKYAKDKIEAYFKDTTLNKTEEVTTHNLRIMALELAIEDGEMKNFMNKFMEYDKFLASWENATQSIYKSFFMIKMRKFLDDIETYYYENCNGLY